MSSVDANANVRITCSVCPHACSIREGGVGLCGARSIQEGRVVSVNFGEAAALSLDPIEKKPLARFRAGTQILSFGSFGCNMSCAFCQNADISQVRACGRPQTVFVAPDELVVKAQELVHAGNIGVALTYNEPLIAPEYLLDVGRLLHEVRMALVVVSNGYANADVFDECASVIDAMNIDLKCFTEKGYESLGAPGGLACVKRNIEAAHAAGVHVEVTTLVVPGLSDSEEDLISECEWLASVSSQIPLHLTRFFPRYQVQDEHPTNPGLLYRFKGIAERYLKYVYVGNV